MYANNKAYLYLRKCLLTVSMPVGAFCADGHLLNLIIIVPRQPSVNFPKRQTKPTKTQTESEVRHIS